MSVMALPAGQDPRIEAWLLDHGVTEWEYRARVPLSEIDKRASLTNQARMEAIDEDHLIVIAEALAQRKPIPPCVFYKRPRIRGLKTIDGNHRVGAADLNGLTHIAAYIITQELTETQEHLLIATANGGHGKPNSLSERVTLGIWLVENRNSTQKDAASLVGIPAKMLSDRIALLAAERRLVDLVGAGKLNRIALNSRRRLHAIRSDVVAKEAADLVSDTRMKTVDVNQLVTIVNKGRSEVDQLAILEDMRRKIQQEKAATAGHKVQIAASFRRLASLTSSIIKFDVESVRDEIVDPQIRQQTKLKIAEAQEKLLQIASAL